MFEQLADRNTGEILTASYLNALSENVAHVWGGAMGINMPFQGYRNNSVGSIDSDSCQWLIRHRLRYVHYKVNVTDPLDYIRLKYTDGTDTITIFANETPGATQAFDSYVDTDGLGLTTGTWYKAYFEIAFVSGSNWITISELCESDSTSFGTDTAESYTPPPQWSRGNAVTTTKINKYKTALDAAHSYLVNQQMAWAARENNTEDRGFFIRNRWRWLHYVGNGEIVDPSGAGTTTEITGSGTEVQVYDLYSTDWMAQGMLYEVKDCTFAVEDYSA